MNSLVSRFAARCALVAAVALCSASAQAIDSTDIPSAGSVTVSNCPNIDGTWYASGSVPSGYYKSTGASGHTAGYCYPVSSCPSGTAWNQTSEACVSTTPTCPSGTVYVASQGACFTAAEASDIGRCDNNLGNWNSTQQSCIHDMYMLGLYNYSVSCSECYFDASQTGSAIQRWSNVRVRETYNGQTDVLDMSGRARTNIKAPSQEALNFGVVYGNGYRARLADGPSLANMALGTPNAATTTWLRSVGCIVRPWNASTQNVIVNGTTGFPAFYEGINYAWGTSYGNNPTGSAPGYYLNVVVLMCTPGAPSPAALG